MRNQAVTMAIRWGQNRSCYDVVRTICFMCISACAELRAALAAPPALPELSRFNPWWKLLWPTHDATTMAQVFLQQILQEILENFSLRASQSGLPKLGIARGYVGAWMLLRCYIFWTLTWYKSKCSDWVLSHRAAGNCQGCFQAFHKWRKSQKGHAAHFVKLICKFQIQIFWCLRSSLISPLWKVCFSLPVTLRSTSADENQLSILQPPTDICTHIMSHV